MSQLPGMIAGGPAGMAFNFRTGGNTNALGALIRSRLRALLSLVLASGLGLCFYFYLCGPILYDTPHLPVEEVREPQIGRYDEMGEAGVQDLPEIGVSPVENITVAQYAVFEQNKTYTDEELMSLPILHHTFEDALDPRNGFQPLRHSKYPWLTTTPTGAMLIDRLSRNRFPPPSSIYSSLGSSPPPIPIWPPRTILQEKHHSLQNPIPKDRIAGLNTSYIWKDRHKIPEGKMPKVQWSGFERHDWETPSDRNNRLERQGWVRRGFQHVWEGYKAKAWGHDELKPLSGEVSHVEIRTIPISLVLFDSRETVD